MRWINKKYICLFIVALSIAITAACSIKIDTNEEEKPTESTTATTKPESTTEEIPETGGSTTLETEQEPLFNFYNIPADWPRVVPLMSEFQVFSYEWTDTGMYAAGYGNVSISRAGNFYTNAKKEHVSSNIWEQNPSIPSITEGTMPVFNYIGEGNLLKVVLSQESDNRISFELYFSPAS